MIYLARHGRTAYNHEGRFQGQGPVPLDNQGRRDAHALAALAADVGFATLWASPLARARETAEIVAAQVGLPIHEDARLAETDCGDWTDLMFADVQAEHPDLFQGFVDGDPDFAFPGGESFADQGDRVMACLADVAGEAQPALVVCHGMVIRLALARHRGERGPGPRMIPNGALLPLDDAAATALPRGSAGG